MARTPRKTRGATRCCDQLSDDVCLPSLFLRTGSVSCLSLRRLCDGSRSDTPQPSERPFPSSPSCSSSVFGFVHSLANPSTPKFNGDSEEPHEDEDSSMDSSLPPPAAATTAAAEASNDASASAFSAAAFAPSASSGPAQTAASNGSDDVVMLDGPNGRPIATGDASPNANGSSSSSSASSASSNSPPKANGRKSSYAFFCAPSAFV